MIRALLAFSLAFISLQGMAQQGCTDPQGQNYNPLATHSDGSCTYPATSQAPLLRQPDLPTEVNETSALRFWNGKYFTLNDSGNDPILFAIDSSTHTILQRLTLTGVPNVDMEALAQDSLYFYVGDFGNNSGTRRNLVIHRVEKASIPASGNASLAVQSIRFSYPDQTSFQSSNTHNFDCEAFVAWGDSLHLFSKNRGDNKTKHYTLPKTPGIYVATLHATLNAGMLITDAAAHPTRNEIALLGYTQTESFIWLLFQFEGTDFFSGNKRKIGLGSLALVGQMEGICYTDSGHVALSNEKLTVGSFTVPPRLWRFNTGRYTHEAFGHIPAGVRPRNEKARFLTYRCQQGRLVLHGAKDMTITLVSMDGRALMDTQWLHAGQELWLPAPSHPLFIVLASGAWGSEAVKVAGKGMVGEH